MKGFDKMSTLLSNQIAAALGNSSMIRKMFEAGNELRKKYGKMVSGG